MVSKLSSIITTYYDLEIHCNSISLILYCHCIEIILLVKDTDLYCIEKSILRFHP